LRILLTLENLFVLAAYASHIDKLTDHLFRHETGKMVAVLTRVFGSENLQIAEDVVQDTLLLALQTWPLKGPPENPQAWLHKVAKNKAIDIIRRNKHSVKFDFSAKDKVLLTSEYTLDNAMQQIWREEGIKDDQLRMMFACCHPGIPPENQVALILKTLCGFSTAEIARAFLSSDDTISKRLYRAKEFFREHQVKLEMPPEAEIPSRNAAVLSAIYLLFNEGYSATHSDQLIRRDLMQEAMILCRLLTENPLTRRPETCALMALMCFHSSRSDSRLTSEGEIILLPDQDRSRWDRNLIAEGNVWMNHAASGEQVSAYHLEAAIAYEHCSAAKFGDTQWPRILQLYEWLCLVAPSPVAELNKVVALLQVHGSAAALSAMERLGSDKRTEGSVLRHALLAEIHHRLGQMNAARDSLERALALSQSQAEQRLLREKLNALDG
jgi:RNA polymerase sigma-70 factor (ECF subfamily)